MGNERLFGLSAGTTGPVRAGRVHRHQHRVHHHARDADRSGRTDHRRGHAVRQHQSRGDRDDAPVAARSCTALSGSLWEQYLVFWKRVSVGDFGPSLSAFPTPVIGPDRSRAALDRRLAPGVDRHQRGSSATCLAAWPATTATAGSCSSPASWRWPFIPSPITSSPSYS